MNKVLHISDLHLGSAFTKMSKEASVRLADARFGTLKKLAALAKELDVEAILVAGDTFDRNDVDSSLIHKALMSMKSFEGPWLIIPGNHDYFSPAGALDRLQQFAAEKNQDVRVLTSFDPVEISNGKIVVLPAPLVRRHEAIDLTANFDVIKTGANQIRIGLAHGCVQEILMDRAAEHNPIGANRAEQARLDYLALGDWHGHKEINERTRYSGTPEPTSFRSAEPGLALEVQIDSAGSAPKVIPHLVGQYDWLQQSFSVYDTADIDAMKSKLLNGNFGEYEVLELTIDGSLDMAGREQINRTLDEIRASRCELRLKDSVAAAPSESELQSFAGAGFVQAAMQDLLERQNTPTINDEERAKLGLAMQMIFSTYKEVANEGQ